MIIRNTDIKPSFILNLCLKTPKFIKSHKDVVMILGYSTNECYFNLLYHHVLGCTNRLDFSLVQYPVPNVHSQSS